MICDPPEGFQIPPEVVHSSRAYNFRRFLCITFVSLIMGLLIVTLIFTSLMALISISCFLFLVLVTRSMSTILSILLKLFLILLVEVM